MVFDVLFQVIEVFLCVWFLVLLRSLVSNYGTSIATGSDISTCPLAPASEHRHGVNYF